DLVTGVQTCALPILGPVVESLSSVSTGSSSRPTASTPSAIATVCRRAVQSGGVAHRGRDRLAKARRGEHLHTIAPRHDPRSDLDDPCNGEGQLYAALGQPHHA